MGEAGKRAPALSDVTVLELGSMLAGPFVGTLLADFGAQVIKAEKPGKPDALREWPPHKYGTPLWWKSMARGKQLITLDISTARRPRRRARTDREERHRHRELQARYARTMGARSSGACEDTGLDGVGASLGLRADGALPAPRRLRDDCRGFQRFGLLHWICRSRADGARHSRSATTLPAYSARSAQW